MVFECKWMTGFRCSVKAEVAGEVMQRLESEGRLTPANLVDEARPEESPMHKAFEWDDAKAAEIYRRHQATQMIRAIVVRESDVVKGGSEAVRVKVFNQPEKGGAYESLRTILMDEEKSGSLLDKAKAELRTFRVKYSQLERLSRLMSEIDRVLDDEGEEV